MLYVVVFEWIPVSSLLSFWSKRLANAVAAWLANSVERFRSSADAAIKNFCSRSSRIVLARL